MTSRRDFLALAAWTPLAGYATSVVPKPKFASDPFSLGVASGYPYPTSVVLWTRLAPKPLEGGGMDPEAVEVRWEVAEDDAFGRIVKSGSAIANPEHAHSVHVEVDGLAPSRWYHYRFHCGDATSRAARTRTAPEAGSGDDRLKLALASCQQYEQGWYTAHRHMAADEPDLVAFLGDYIYESSWGRDHVRKHGSAEPATLDDYRNRYALYKSDPDLQKSHAAAPWVTIWDDHEVDNDYAGDRSEELDPSFLKRRARAYKAFWEHMPMRRTVLATDGGIRIYGALEWGSLARLNLLDGRQYRSHQACPKPYRGGGNYLPDCPARFEPTLSLLGLEQERWLDASLKDSRAGWNLILQTTLFAPGPRPSDKGLVYWTDGWDGYPAARERLIKSITDHRPANPVVMGGDVHAAIHANVHEKPAEAASRVVAAELVATSITSQGGSPRASEAQRNANPHIRYADNQVRGYHLVDIGRSALDAQVRAVASVKLADAGISTVARARVEAGKPGLAE